MSTMLSRHFSLEEMTVSQTAARLGIDNSPNEEQLANLGRTAALLDDVRDVLSEDRGEEIPVSVTSGLRVPALNDMTPGSARNPPSAHTEGRAGDFIAPKFGSPKAVAIKLAASDLPFDQLIYEFGSWVHIAVAKDGAEPRRQVLTIDRSGTRLGIDG